MKFTKDTTFDEICGNNFQGFYETGNGELTVLYQDGDGEYIVASFDEQEFCTNASGHNRRHEAWQLFVEIVQDDLAKLRLAIDPQPTAESELSGPPR